MIAEMPAAAPLPDSPDNPLVAAAAPLLNTIVQIRQAATHDDPGGLRQQLIAEVRDFENQCKKSSLPFEMIIGARYCLCSVLDEAAAQTPWGSRGVWSSNGLLVTFHNESWGGDKFFQLLSRISQNPAQHLWLLEVIHYCLLLGYEGRYRAVENGRQQRDGVRDRLAELIQNTRAQSYVDHPSPAPVIAPESGVAWRPVLPLWAGGAIAALVACLTFSALNWQLGSTTAGLLKQIWQIPLPKVVQGQRGASSQVLQNLRQRLSDLIAARELDVTDIANGCKVILSADRLFNEHDTQLSPGGRALVARVAAAMESVKGVIVVTAWTDDRRERSAHFPSNYEYSQAQAQAVSTMMQQVIAQPGMTIEAQGRGESGALLPNDSDENRAHNRRVEITLFAAPEPETGRASPGTN